MRKVSSSSGNDREKEERKKRIIVVTNFILIILNFTSALLGGCSKEGKPAGAQKQFFKVDFYYTQKVTNLYCFIIEFVEILSNNEVQPILSGYFTAKIGETPDTKAIGVRSFNKGKNRWEEGGEVEVKILPDKLSITVMPIHIPARKSYFEVKVLGAQLDELCREQYKSGRSYQGLVALGRTPFFDPAQIKETTGIISPVGEPDIFPSILSTTRAYPMVVQLEQDVKTGFRKFLLCGGMDIVTRRVMRTCEIIDEKNLSILPGPVMNFPRIFGAISLLTSGGVAVSGGLDSSMKPVPFLEIYDPLFGIFLRMTKVLPRFKAHIFSTEQNIAIVGGVGEGGMWDRRIEIFPHSPTQNKPAEIKRFLYSLDNAGNFGACFAEDDQRVYIVGGIGFPPQIIRIYKERIDAGVVEADVVKIEGVQSFGNCKALTLGSKILIMGSYGKLYLVTWDKQNVLVNQDDLLKYTDQKSKKGFSFVKLSESKAVIFGGFDYVTSQEGQTYSVIPSQDIFLVSKDGVTQRQKAVYPSEGGWAFIFADEYLVIVGGNKEGKAQVSFVGRVEFPEGVTNMGIEYGEEGKGGGGTSQ